MIGNHFGVATFIQHGIRESSAKGILPIIGYPTISRAIDVGHGTDYCAGVYSPTQCCTDTHIRTHPDFYRIKEEFSETFYMFIIIVPYLINAIQGIPPADWL